MERQLLGTRQSSRAHEALGDHEDQQDRQDDQDGGEDNLRLFDRNVIGRQVAEGAGGRDQHRETDRQVVELVVAQEHKGEEVVAPDADEAEERHERDDRPGQRQAGRRARRQQQNRHVHALAAQFVGPVLGRAAGGRFDALDARGNAGRTHGELLVGG